MKESSEITAGKKLKTTRLRLLLTRVDVYQITGIPVTTIERIEKDELPYPPHHLENLISFYGYTKEEISSNKEMLTWVELSRRYKANHRNNPLAMEIINKKPSPKEVILYRLLTSKTLDNFVTVKELSDKIKATYNWKFQTGTFQNALDSVTNDGYLIKSKTTPIKYKRLTNKLPAEIDKYYEITCKLKEIEYDKDVILVNPAFGKMAIIIKHLLNGERTRRELMDKSNLNNETNNVNRTIKVLESMQLIEKTEKHATSKNQKYRLIEKGINFLKKLGFTPSQRNDSSSD